MPALAPAVLAVAIVLSALGAVVLCLLVVLYGFTPAGEEPPGSAARRHLVTRIGHVVAAVCFTVTAILLSVVLARPTRAPAPIPPPMDARVPALGARLQEQEARLTATEARLKDLESTMRREAARPAPAPEPARTEPARVKPPAPAVRSTPAPRPSPTTSRASAPTFQRVDPPPVLVIPAAPPERTIPAPRSAVPAPPSPVAIVEPPPVPAPAAAAAPRDVEVAASAARAPVPAPVSVAPSGPAALEPAPAPAARLDLRRKLREDWATIRRGIESGERDFWRAVDETKRNFRSLVRD
jgi:hypothetical protein